MIRLALLISLAALPAQAMTIEDCRRLQSSLAATLPAINDIRLSPSVTEDGWCRVIDGPIGGGLEWKMSGGLEDFNVEVRQKRLEIEELGPFDLTGSVEAQPSGGIEIGPFQLVTGAKDRAIISAATGRGTASDTTSLSLTRAALSVAGERALVNDILAWAFRLDASAADSSLIAAGDQREEMLTWLEDEAADLIDEGSAAAFRKMVDAYPRARGKAEIRMSEDKPLAVGPVVTAVLFGGDFSRQDAAALIEEAGLSFTWTPE